MALGLIVGAGAMYFLDPDSGSQRRQQALHLWAENKDDVYQTAQKAASQVQEASGQAAAVVGKTGEAAAKVKNTIAEKVSEGSSNEADPGIEIPSSPTVVNPSPEATG